MEIRTLTNTAHEDIVGCFVEAFAGYFVAMPEDLGYWQQRWRGARVAFGLSVGAFADDRLVGFILHGVDGAAACNVGTGVLPAYRGRRLVQEMYAFVMPLLRQEGVRHLGLEVITDNAAAIKAYERAGFVICRTLLCFAGEVVDQPERALTIRSRPVTSEQLGKASGHGSYAWDHIDAGILALADAYQLYEVCKDDTFIGQIVLHPDTGILARCDLAGPETLEGYRCLLEAAGRVQRKIRIVNVDERLRTRISAIGESGLLLTLKQYEMERAL